jgi:hypothetical protein
MPASSIVKPACIPKTRNAPSRTHIVLIGLMTGFFAMSTMSPGITGITEGASVWA